jgi:hypothetical protein
MCAKALIKNVSWTRRFSTVDNFAAAQKRHVIDWYGKCFKFCTVAKRVPVYSLTFVALKDVTVILTPIIFTSRMSH